MPHESGRGGLIQGVVAEDGVPKVDAPVYLYDRTNGKLVRRTRTAADGSFAVRDLNRDSADYMVVALDQDGVSPKNALIYDRIQPVNDVAGETWNLNWLCLMKARSVICLAQFGTEIAHHIPAAAITYGGSNNCVFKMYTGGSSGVAKAANLTPGWPELQSLQFTTARYWFMAYPGSCNGGSGGFGPAEEDYGLGGNNRPVFVLEAVPVLSTTAAHGLSIECTRASGSTDGSVTGASYSDTAFCVEFTAGATRYLRVWAHTSPTVLAVANTRNLVNTVYCSVVLTLDITSIGVGAVHFIVELDYAGDIKVYVNGALFHTSDLSALIQVCPPNYPAYTTAEGASRPRGLVIGGIYPAVATTGTGYNSGNYLTSGQLALAALYEGYITPDTVLLHYLALMTTTVKPVFTGYRKRIIESRPMRYWDLCPSDGDEALYEVFRRRPAAATLKPRGRASVAYMPGPREGENALFLQPGQAFFGRDAGSIINKNAITVEFWVYRPAGRLLIVASMFKSGGWNNYNGVPLSVVCSTTGAIIFTERTFSGTTEYANNYTTTSTPITPDVWHHVAIQINTTLNRLDVWVDAVKLTDEVVTSAFGTDFMDQTAGNAFWKTTGYEVDVGIGAATAYPYISNNFTGGVAHLALYSRKLTEAEILDHYLNINEA